MYALNGTNLQSLVSGPKNQSSILSLRTGLNFSNRSANLLKVKIMDYVQSV